MTHVATLRRLFSAVAVGALLSAAAPASAAGPVYDPAYAGHFFVEDAGTSHRMDPETTGSIGFVVIDRCGQIGHGSRLDFVGGCAETTEMQAQVQAQAPQAPTRADPISLADVPNPGWSTYDPGLDRGVPED